MDGGHFIAKGNSSYWALELVNVHPQCKWCNSRGMKYGSAAQIYTVWMQREYGHEFVEMMLNDRRKIRKLYAADYREMLADWSAQIKHHEKRIGS